MSPNKHTEVWSASRLRRLALLLALAAIAVPVFLGEGSTASPPLPSLAELRDSSATPAALDGSEEVGTVAASDKSAPTEEN